MKTNANSRYTVAVLIDGDNASFERMEDIMGFVSRYGDAVVRRIYGDWTRKALSAWKESAREHGFRLVQASSHVPGKNTTDIALVIDAMDILRDGQADCFCLVASDGDYSLLAQRIREAGVKVLGYGEGKTPVSLVRSCSVFLYADRKESKAHVPGKNTTDIALVIDAMDILRDGQADCFCLVASDGDYSLLAQRIREAGVKVLGYGEGKTPVSLVRSCSVFLYADRKESKAEENTPEFFIRRDMEYFDKAFEQAADGKEEVSLSLIGGALKKMMPKFKVRRYGCKTLGKLYEKLDTGMSWS